MPSRQSREIMLGMLGNSFGFLPIRKCSTIPGTQSCVSIFCGCGLHTEYTVLLCTLIVSCEKAVVAGLLMTGRSPLCSPSARLLPTE
jgi:hypothetical protein